MYRSVTGRKVLGTVVLGWLGLMAGHALGADATSEAVSYVKKNKQAFGLTGADITEMPVSDLVTSRHNGVTHVYLQQHYRGIEVWNAIINVNVSEDGSVISAGSTFVPHIAAAAGGQNARKTGVDAAQAAARHLELKPSRPFEVLKRQGGPNEKVTLSDGGISTKPIDARLVWLPQDGDVRLAWVLEIEPSDGVHSWYAFVDAQTGESLGQVDLVINDSIEAIGSAIARPQGSPAALLSFAPTDGATYRVFPLPLESPTDGDRELVSNAADPNASPFGWHDTDGLAGPEFTVTRGNNVHAYTDVDANGIPDPGSDPDGGAGLVFDFPLDLALGPETYRPAAVTNLFYWNNVVHDITHAYGFDEASGNFQVNNYGNGGIGGDDVRAEAQDGSGTNNANFLTNVDGNRPRMQMFVWTHPTPNILTVNSPAVIAGDYSVSGAAFGPTLATTGPITGTVSLVDDAAGASTSDGCEPLVGFPAGNIALVDRGICAFTIKVRNAQDAGAVAVIVANNAPGGTITMGGADPAVVIPSVMVSLDDGNLIKVNLPVNATLRGDPQAISRDSDLDAGVIAHEYGHGISNRLTGGPGTLCLGGNEQMGEGWSDWFALTLTTHPSDTATTPRGVGTYLLFQPADGVGIRPTPYTTDMSVNPSTYDTVKVAAIPHGVGYVWNTMLWEVYWNLVDRYGYNANIYEGASSGGNNLAIQLVMDGMKFQPCFPGFVDGRDAILAADMALTGGTNQCEIWRGFAKRGLGAAADQGSVASVQDGVESFDLPASCTAATFGGFRPPVLDAPAINPWIAGHVVPLKFIVNGDTSSLQVDSQPVSCTTLEPTGEAPEMISTPGSSTLKQKGSEFQVKWQTDAAWAGTCRRVTVRIPAESDGIAYFSF